jgi:peptide-methionine (S)-S-oxide reductase
MKPTSLTVLFSTVFLAMTLPASAVATDSKTETLVLGGGCFWCTEAAYELVPGVKNVVSGYSGGAVKNPSYKQISTGGTGHAEVIRIEYDPAEVSLERLLQLFWVVHDPTTLNRQGNDEGTQYRSVIYFADDAQKAAAEKAKITAQAKFGDPIVTEIAPLGTFYEAEEYHQDYFRKNPNAGYCQFVVKSKVNKMQKALGK